MSKPSYEFKRMVGSVRSTPTGEMLNYCASVCDELITRGHASIPLIDMVQALLAVAQDAEREIEEADNEQP